MTHIYPYPALTIQNTSRHPRRGDWVTIPIPTREDIGVLSCRSCPVVGGLRLSPEVQLAHVHVGPLGPLEGFTSRLEDFDHPDPDCLTVKEGASDAYDANNWVLQPGHVRSGEPAPTAELPGELPRLDFLVGDRRVSWTPDPYVMRRDAAHTVWRASHRIPGTSFVAIAWFYAYFAWRVVPFELVVCNSDPRTTRRVGRVRGVELVAPGTCFPSIDFLTARGGTREYVNVDLRTRLTGDTWFGDGQAAAWSGRLVYWGRSRTSDLKSLVAAVDGPVVGMATPADWRGAWGPWGQVPDLHPGARPPDGSPVRTGWAGAIELGVEFLRTLGLAGTVWESAAADRYGLAADPHRSGDQQDFGITKLAPAMAVDGGNPFHLFELGPSILKEAGRPIHYLEVDGELVEPVDHPDWRTWNAQTHYHPMVSHDQLGKVPWSGNPTNTLATKDWGHFSSNNLAGWTQLTGSELGVWLLEAELATIEAFHELGEARGYGRVLLAVAWAWTVRTKFRPGILRFAKRLAQLDAWNVPLPVKDLEFSVAPFEVREKEPKHYAGESRFWMPWQEALLIAGLDALLNVAAGDMETADVDRLRSARTWITANWLRWGLAEGEDGKLWSFWTVRYDSATPVDYASGKDAVPIDGNAFLWGWPAAAIADRLFRHQDNELGERARRLVGELEQHRQGRPASRFGFDQGGEWRLAFDSQGAEPQ